MANIDVELQSITKKFGEFVAVAEFRDNILGGVAEFKVIGKAVAFILLED